MCETSPQQTFCSSSSKTSGFSLPDMRREDWIKCMKKKKTNLKQSDDKLKDDFLANPIFKCLCITRHQDLEVQSLSRSLLLATVEWHNYLYDKSSYRPHFLFLASVSHSFSTPNVAYVGPFFCHFLLFSLDFVYIFKAERDFPFFFLSLFVYLFSFVKFLVDCIC